MHTAVCAQGCVVLLLLLVAPSCCPPNAAVCNRYGSPSGCPSNAAVCKHCYDMMLVSTLRVYTIIYCRVRLMCAGCITLPFRVGWLSSRRDTAGYYNSATYCGHPTLVKKCGGCEPAVIIRFEGPQNGNEYIRVDNKFIVSGYKRKHVLTLFVLTLLFSLRLTNLSKKGSY